MPWQCPNLPFLDERHRQLALDVGYWCETNRATLLPGDGGDFADHCRKIVRSLGQAGFLDHVLPVALADDGQPAMDIRSICVVREALAYESNLAAALFAIQGMGLSPLRRFGCREMRDRYISPARAGESIGAIAISEANGGSDVSGISTIARRDGHDFRISGEKMWIANGGLADHYLVLARTDVDEPKGAISAFLVDADLPGVEPGAPIDILDGFPLAAVTFNDVRVPAGQLVGEVGQGLSIAMSGFDLFRPSVGAAAVGVAKRALDASVARVRNRSLFGKPMSQLDGVPARLADMLADIETGALAVYRAAWAGDCSAERFSTYAALSKLVATEAAQRVVDSAVQIFGAEGVTEDSLIARLYRELRPMRIYEGASEIQKMIIARSILRGGAKA